MHLRKILFYFFIKNSFDTDNLSQELPGPSKDTLSAEELTLGSALNRFSLTLTVKSYNLAINEKDSTRVKVKLLRLKLHGIIYPDDFDL